MGVTRLRALSGLIAAPTIFSPPRAGVAKSAALEFPQQFPEGTIEQGDFHIAFAGASHGGSKSALAAG